MVMCFHGIIPLVSTWLNVASILLNLTSSLNLFLLQGTAVNTHPATTRTQSRSKSQQNQNDPKYLVYSPDDDNSSSEEDAADEPDYDEDDDEDVPGALSLIGDGG